MTTKKNYKEKMIENTKIWIQEKWKNIKVLKKTKKKLKKKKKQIAKLINDDGEDITGSGCDKKNGGKIL